ncbi:hypothetical protein A8A54_19065 [Brucella pseudogrignonensis]|uniref:LysR family transcriptional regulator n=1 Tax=Brucella pseudogrignonensis TaxID=419475 RepID=UPI0007DA8B7A|nr:LysR family transcriptional regulator [Brucella pseudogrignonensis]ANG98710.1 hypothetical protein A8A54_19065 [Brucella pseudogrignonensis]
MDFRLMRHLYYFLAVAEELHFGRAAQRLGITQPPLSAQIKVLEHALRAQLFERSNSGVRLTQAGQAILPQVRAAVEQAGKLEGLVKGAQSGQIQTLRVGATNSAMFEPLGEALAVARVEIPGTVFHTREMESAQAISAVRHNEVDIAVAWVDRLSPPLKSIVLERKRLVLVCPRDHRLAARTTVTFADLQGEPIIMCDRRMGPEYFDAISHVALENGVTLNVAHEVRSIPAQIAMVYCGEGLALVPEIATHYSGNHVVYRHFAEDVRVMPLAVIWNEDRVSDAARAFISILDRY